MNALLFPVISLVAFIATDLIKRRVARRYWQTRNGKWALRLVPVAIGGLFFVALGRLGVVDVGGVDMEALWGLSGGASAIAAFHVTKPQRG